MKYLFSIVFLSALLNSHSQILSGALLDDKRPMTSKTNFVIESNYDGYVVYEIAVDIYGKVSSTRLIAEKSNITSTPANFEAKNLLKSMTFKEGEYFPKFHYGLVKITFVKPKLK